MSVYEVLILLAGLIFFVASFFSAGKKVPGRKLIRMRKSARSKRQQFYMRARYVSG